MATRWVHFRVEEEIAEQMRLAAIADRRSLSNWVALTVERALSESSPEPADREQPALLQRF